MQCGRQQNITTTGLPARESEACSTNRQRAPMIGTANESSRANSLSSQPPAASAAALCNHLDWPRVCARKRPPLLAADSQWLPLCLKTHVPIYSLRGSWWLRYCDNRTQSAEQLGSATSRQLLAHTTSLSACRHTRKTARWRAE